MYNLIHYRRPVREWQHLHDQIWNSFATTTAPEGTAPESSTPLDWTPLADVAEDDRGYQISLDLPGVAKEAVKVTLENGVLSVAGERKAESDQETDRRWHRVERSFGSFTRRFALPKDADPQKVNAEFKDGVLKVRVTKSEAALPRQIEVQGA